jgi:hypothetical protein
MNLVKLSTKVLEFVTKKSLSKAESRNQKAMKKVKSAKTEADKASFDLKAKQAETLIQLTKVQKMSEEIGEKSALQAGKAEKINALLQEIED